MKHRLAMGVAIVAAGVLLMFFYQSASVSSRTGEDAPLYSVRRHDPYGTAALHDLLIERGVPVRTLERPALERDDHGILIQVLADNSQIRSDYQPRVQAIVDWISRGNTVVQLTRSPTDLSEFVKLKPTTQPALSDLKTLHEFESNGGAPDQTPASIRHAESIPPGGPELMLWSPTRFADQKDIAWKPLARLGAGKDQTVAGEIAIGRGKLIVVGAPTPALNGTIGSSGNLDFLLGVIGDTPVIFDEWSHGIGHERTVISFLHDVGLLPLLFQAALVAGLYVWSTSGYGKPAEEGVNRQRSSVEQIETLGYLYSRSLGTAVTFERVNQEVQRRLAGALRCQPSELASRVPALKPDLRIRVEQMFAQLDHLRSGQGIHCLKCGYDLSFNESGRCPECGYHMPPDARQKLLNTQAESRVSARLATRSTAPDTGQPRRFNAALANVLSASHQLTLEVIRDRRSPR
jgi:hypothetical protein